jgi:putative FmdB family regulatory protein
MPIVNYKCAACGKEFAKLFFDEKNAPKVCPVCKATGLREIGFAFPENNESLERFMTVSCDGCGDESCGIAPSS